MGSGAFFFGEPSRNHAGGVRVCARFTCAQWDAKVKEIADIGMEYLILMATALDYRSFYPSQVWASWQLACSDPLESVLAAADNYGVKLFIGAGF